jgi:hypothetical protein
MLRVDYIISDKPVNWKITIGGIVFLIFRMWFMTGLIEPDGRFHPEIFHTSYLISIFMCLAMVFSFKVKPLNVVPIAVLPSVLFSIILHDIPLWINPGGGMFPGAQIGDLLWWNFLTIHTPIPFLAAYMYATRKETLSVHSYFIMFPIFFFWFMFLDDKVNGAVDGPTYFAIGLPILFIWTYIYWKVVCRDIPPGDPLIARPVTIKSIKWVSKSA